jgi:hypothetical protein
MWSNAHYSFLKICSLLISDKHEIRNINIFVCVYIVFLYVWVRQLVCVIENSL